MNVSFEQEWGPSANFVFKGSIAKWSFTQINNDSIEVNIWFDNSNYVGPVPVYTYVQRLPWIEVTLIVGGGLIIGVSLGVYLLQKNEILNKREI
ncbi:MAG: hypothetical protein P8Y70_10505 [Candidatus Lokiarchaeota archaeon]